MNKHINNNLNKHCEAINVLKKALCGIGGELFKEAFKDDSEKLQNEELKQLFMHQFMNKLLDKKAEFISEKEQQFFQIAQSIAFLAQST